jgi:hypothetical protein
MRRSSFHSFPAVWALVLTVPATIARGADQPAGAVHHALRQPEPAREHADNEAAWPGFARGITLLQGGAPRREVLAQWRQTLKLYGQSRYREQLEDLIGQLEKQVVEDEQLAATEVDDPEELPLGQRIDYHLARLVDVRGVQGSQPGHCLTYGMKEGTESSDGLIEIGRAAVPGLIGHLDDRRLTRSIGLWRDYAPSRTVLRVQDVAVQCIGQILDIRFYHPSSTSSYLSNEEESVRRAVIEDVKSWWGEYGGKPPLEGYLGRLEQGSYHDRLDMLRKVEELDRGAVDSVALLKRWAVEADYRQLPMLAEALADRGDFSLLPAMRKTLRDGSRNVPGQCIWYLLRHGDASDYRYLRKAARAEIERGAKLGSTRIWGAVKAGVEGSNMPLAVPILVDLLDRRQITGSRWISEDKGSMGFSCADSCIGALIRLTGHNEGYQPGDPQPERYAAIDRWIEWWQREGKAAYLDEHPEVRQVYEEQTPVAEAPIVVEPIDSSALTEIGEVGLFWREPVFDAQGRIWFGLYDHRQGVEETKREVEAAFAGDQRVIRGAQLLTFDAQGRLWLIPRQNIRLLLGYNPQSKQWIERAGLADPERVGYDDRDPNTPAYCFTGPAFQTADGPLLVADRLGIHVLDGRNWSYQHLYLRNLDEQYPPDRIKCFNTPELAEGPDGTVYVWSVGGRWGWGGTIGYWTFHGRHWKNVDQYGSPEAVIPRQEGDVWLLCGGQFTRLQAVGTISGEEAQAALCRNLRFGRARLVARDRRSETACFLLDDVTVLEPFEKVKYRALALPPHGRAVDLGNQAGGRLASICPRGVVTGPGGWLFGSDGHRVYAVSADGQRFRRLAGDPRVSNAVIQASDCRRFVYLTGGGKAWRLEFVPPPGR